MGDRAEEIRDDGLLPADADLEKVLDIGRVSAERELTALWRTHWQVRMYQQTLQNPDASDWLRERSRAQLAELAPVTPVHALAANARLVELLTGQRWILMRDAREAGESWSSIGRALGMSKQGAQDWYRRAIERQEEHIPDLHDGARARAALDEA
ncbi:hypothetical protein ACFORH_43320 [Amycolatopsis roodepoortensis]|uniref:Sigma-70 family RNA polymerase sigma factor n=1 Tax=Amycolatopsis roodepoortensis TaxID=700274 RepID=A0ABR9LIR1_9PSEU|nr:hypothetical protein [Amycolatopsis roodepoortensis]MBE1580427.1 hypothetical protein [Amycolatopsis roodepoortensis]